MATYYIRADGNDSHAGTSDSAAGAFLTFAPVASGGGHEAAAGDTIFVRGSGTDTPSSADFTIASTVTFNVFGGGAGFGFYPAKIVGYNGRPRIEGAGRLFAASGILLKTLYICSTGTGGSTNTMCASGGGSLQSEMEDVVLDMNGYSVSGTDFASVIGCAGLDSGAGGYTGSGDVAGWSGDVSTVFPSFVQGAAGEPSGTTNGHYIGNVVRGWKGAAFAHVNGHTVAHNLIVSPAGYGIFQIVGNGFNCWVAFNTIISAGIDGIRCNVHGGTDAATDTLSINIIRNNLITDSARYGIGLNSTSTSGAVAACPRLPDYNAFYNSTTADYQSPMSAGAHDVVLTSDPFVNRAGLDYRLTAAANSAIGRASWPTAYRGVTA